MAEEKLKRVRKWQKETHKLIDEETCKCKWCEEEYEPGQLYETELGKLCNRCIAAILSRGEHIWVKE